jgi:NADH-quinone oxidoreductase subunit J
MAAGPLMNGQVPLGEAIAFWILGPISLAGGIGMVVQRNAVHSALSLAATMMSLGAMYIVEQGPFIGLVQVIVYTGAIMILFLFVLMLVGRDSSDSLVETLRGQRSAAALAGIGFALLVALTIGRAFKGIKPTNLDAANAGGANVNSLADLIFTKYLFAFELTSALLIVAAVAAMVLAHIERDEPKPTQKSLARARIRSGRPQPLPGPGVLSSGNAIGTPALLPDGSISSESVMASAPGAFESSDRPVLLPGEDVP